VALARTRAGVRPQTAQANLIDTLYHTIEGKKCNPKLSSVGGGLSNASRGFRDASSRPLRCANGLLYSIIRWIDG